LTRSTAALPYVLRCAKSFSQQSRTQLDDQVDVKLRPAGYSWSADARAAVLELGELGGLLGRELVGQIAPTLEGVAAA
jgi:hypothetical protein